VLIKRSFGVSIGLKNGSMACIDLFAGMVAPSELGSWRKILSYGQGGVPEATLKKDVGWLVNFLHPHLAYRKLSVTKAGKGRVTFHIGIPSKIPAF
jgi:hypothetical protein